MNLKKIIVGFVVINAFIIAISIGMVSLISFVPDVSYGQTETTTTTDTAPAHESPAAPTSSRIFEWGFLAAALATGLSSVAAGVAVGQVGSAAMGAISEKPELTGRALIFVGLAEGIAIYGLIISIMILGRLPG
jgi:V/A-type H+-transporting ATPase subunit K